MAVIPASEPRKKFNILSPIGGFGNHVRWLALLDPEFQFRIKGSIESYSKVRGPDWPSYDDYKISNWQNTSLEIKNEIVNIFLEDLDCVDLESKIKFIQERVYHLTRTWKNWLFVEWKYRQDLNKFIDFEHQISDLKNINTPTLVLITDPDLAYRSYLKFNSNLNNSPVEHFKEIVMKCNKLNSTLKKFNSNTLVLDSKVLFQPELDQKFYKQLTDWAELSSQYDAANFVHGLWYSAHKRSEREIINDLSAFYK